MISVKQSDDNSNSYLDVIKNSGTFQYKEITFRGVRAITTTRTIQNGYQRVPNRDVLFFKDGYFYTIIIVAINSNQLDTMFNNLKTSFNTTNNASNN